MTSGSKTGRDELQARQRRGAAKHAGPGDHGDADHGHEHRRRHSPARREPGEHQPDQHHRHAISGCSTEAVTGARQIGNRMPASIALAIGFGMLVIARPSAGHSPLSTIARRRR